jgi:hypothetical protein
MLPQALCFPDLSLLDLCLFPKLISTFHSVQKAPDFQFCYHALKRMASFGMLRHVALVRTDVSEERSAFIIKVTKIGELGTTLALTSNRRTLRRKTKSKFLRNVGS